MDYNNYDEVFTYEHLLKAAELCKKNVGWKASVQNFMLEKEYNVAALYRELHDGSFCVKHRHHFDIFERGKKRHIQSVHIRERVVQRCLCDYCLTPLLEPTLCYDNCASQKGKGVSFALNRVRTHLERYYHKYGSNGYVLLFDYTDYFGSIDHDIIMKQLSKYVTDDRLLNIVRLFLNEFDHGLGLGSQVSQVLSLFAASPIDHMVKDELRFRYYIRYMDDGLVIHHDKAELVKLCELIKNRSEKYGLSLSEKKTHITSLKNFRFLKKKYSLAENGSISIRLVSTSYTRMRRKLTKFYGLWKDGKISLEDIQRSYFSWRGSVLKYDSYNSVCRMDEKYNELVNKILSERR